MTKKTVRGVLVDVDGTLLDSNEAHSLSWQSAFWEHGHEVELSAIRPMIGKGGDKLLREVLDISAGSPLGQAVSKSRGEVFKRDHLPHLNATRGARSLLQRFHADGMKVVVATSATNAELGALLEQAGVADLVDGATTSDDAASSKPDPDIVEAALKKIGCDAEQVFMLGDTPYDIEAASAAGVITVALRCGGFWDDAALSAATGIFDDPEELMLCLSTAAFYS